MKLKDNQLAAIVFTITMLTVILYRIVNQETGIFAYYFSSTEIRLYMNLVVLLFCFISIYGLVKLLRRSLRRGD